MDTQTPIEPAALVALVPVMRAGRTARQALEALFAWPESRKKGARLNWLDNLDHATRKLDLAPGVRLAETAHATPVVGWFDGCVSDVIARLVTRLATTGGPDGPGEQRLLGLVRATRLGLQAEDAFATRVRAGLLERSPGYADLLPPHLSQSDLVQVAVMGLIEWAVKAFAGTADEELWACAHQRLEWVALDARRPEPQGHLSGADVADRARPAAAALIDRETRERFDRCLDAWPEPDRMLFRLHYADGLTYDKLAALLGDGQTADAVGRRVRKMLETLHGAVGGD